MSTTDIIQEQTTTSLKKITFWLASGGFAIGASEFASMGLLPYFAKDFAVSEDLAGHAISAYALGVVIGAPILTVLCAKVPRKYILVALMAFYAIGNLLSAIATNIDIMNIARFICGLPHGAYFGIAMLFAAEIAGKGKRAKAVSHVILGLAVANVVGVPIINLVGQYWGWRSSFVLIAGIAVLSALMISKTAPYKKINADIRPLDELAAFKNIHVILVLLMSAIGFGAVFSVYAYFSAAYLDTANAPEWGVSVALMIFGAGNVLGNYVAGVASGGRLLLSAFVFQMIMAVAAVIYAMSVGNPYLMSFCLFLFGLGTGLVVPLQTRLMDIAGDAKMLAGSLNQAAFNVANAFGPWLSGLALAAGYSWAMTGWVGLILAVSGVMILGVICLFDRTIDHRKGE